MNAQADAGSFVLNHRPELQVGRIYINPLRMKSYLIMGIGNSWSPGGQHVTTLNVSYGHPMYKTLEVPWSAMYSEPRAFGFTDVNEYEKLKAASAEGEIKEDEELKEAK